MHHKTADTPKTTGRVIHWGVRWYDLFGHLPDDVKAKGFLEIRRVLKPGGRFMAMDFAAPSHSPLGHLLSIFGHSHGESVVGKLVPMLEEASFSDVEDITTHHKNFAFIRATHDREEHAHG
jgi:ubiquinone/menaquinone biosynthesis C-methylase UbiE